MVVFWSIAACLPVHGAVPTRTVALSGEQPPGTVVGVDFLSFNAPSIDASGRAAFPATLTGAAVSGANDRGIWSEGPGGLGLVARAGSQAPGTVAGVNFASFSVLMAFNRQGQSAFFAALTGTGVDMTNEESIWSNASGTLALVAREGSQATGAPPGVNLAGFSVPVLDHSGHTAFWAALSGMGVDGMNDESVYSEAPGALSLIARKGSSAPGTPMGVQYLGLGNPLINGSGRTTFQAFLTGMGVDATNDQGLWSEGPGGLMLVVRAGDPAPGTPPGVNFSGFAGGAINEVGQTAFFGALTGMSVDGTNDGAIWSEGPGVLTLLTREGSPAPGVAADVNFSFLNSPVLNGAGHSAFRAVLTGMGVDNSNEFGIWSETPGALTLIAREGSPAAGTPPGVGFNGFDQPVINGNGRTVFRATLTGAGVDASNDEGIWVHDGDETLQLVIREGETIEVAPGDDRTVCGLSLLEGTSGEDGRSTSVNNADQIAFRAAFDDGTEGVFVTVGPDADADGVNDAFDNCPAQANADQADADGDAVGNDCDVCDGDDASGDSDGDGACDDLDGCPSDASKTAPVACGCGTADADANGNGTPDCLDQPPAPQAATGCCAPGVFPAVALVAPALVVGWKFRRKRTQGGPLCNRIGKR